MWKETGVRRKRRQSHLKRHRKGIRWVLGEPVERAALLRRCFHRKRNCSLCRGPRPRSFIILNIRL